MIYIGICDDVKTHRTMMYETAFRAMFEFDEVEFICYESGARVIEGSEQTRFQWELLPVEIYLSGIFLCA